MANFIPLANGASLGSYKDKKFIFLVKKKGKNGLTKMTLAANLPTFLKSGFLFLGCVKNKIYLRSNFVTDRQTDRQIL